MPDDGGVSRLRKRMAALPEKMLEGVEPALMKSGNEVAATMKSLAPVDSGDLVDSIAVTGPGQSTPPYSQPGGSMVVPENAVAITVGNADVRYGHLIEYGTIRNAPHPYFWPSVRLYRKRVTRRIKRAVNKSMRENWGSQ